MTKAISVSNMSENSPHFPFNPNLVDDDSLRLMSISERASLATERILAWGSNNLISPEDWVVKITTEIERVAVETVISCAMMLEQDFPNQLENRENGEVIGGAAGGYLRRHMDTIVAGISIEEDHSVDCDLLEGKDA